MNKGQQQSIFLATIAILFWVTVATAFKLGLRSFTPYELVFYASITSFVVLFFLAAFKHRGELFQIYNNPKTVLVSLGQGALNPFLYYIVLFAAYDLLPAQVAEPINFTWPIFLSIFAVVFLGEQFTSKTFPALLLSFIGVVVVSTQGNFSEETLLVSKAGIFLGLLSAVIWAAFWIINIKDTRPPLVKLFWSFFFGNIYIIVFGLLTDKINTPLNLSISVYPIYIGLFEMSITFYLWLGALRKAKNTPFISNLVYLVPILSLFIINIVLKEKLHLTTFIGLFLIISGVALQSAISKKQ
jgi:drug/metabolite transporter (DMT)-like permease